MVHGNHHTILECTATIIQGVITPHKLQSLVIRQVFSACGHVKKLQHVMLLLRVDDTVLCRIVFLWGVGFAGSATACSSSHRVLLRLFFEQLHKNASISLITTGKVLNIFFSTAIEK